MAGEQIVTREHFIKRVVDLCVRSGLKGFPKDEVDLHILLKSAVLVVGSGNSLTEKQINERLERWILLVGQMKEIDRVTLRRRLVDTGYLTRSTDGSNYQVSQAGPRPQLFDPAIDQVDIPEVIRAAKEEIARRKREYLEKANRSEK